MPNKIPDYYKALDTSIEAVYTRKIEFERNQFIKDRYEKKKNTLKNRKGLVGFYDSDFLKNSQRYQEIKEELKFAKKAYEAIKSEPLRKLYNPQLLLQQQQEREEGHSLTLQHNDTRKEQFRESVKYEEEEDLYQVLGIFKKELDFKRTKEQQQDFLIEAYYKQINKWQEIMQLKYLPSEIERIKGKIQKCQEAYEILSSPTLKEEYDKDRYENKNKMDTFIPKKTAYDVLGITMSELHNYTVEEADNIIKKRRKRLLEECQTGIQESRNPTEIHRLSVKIKFIEEAFELLKSVGRRTRYNADLQKREEEQKRVLKKQEIERKYNHVAEYNPDLIDNLKPSKTMTLENKAVIRHEKLEKERFYMDRFNRRLRIRKTGEVLYRSYLNGIETIEEYEVIRTINGVEKRDIVYTNLEKIKLATNQENGKIEDFAYYDCVMNEMFSEESIEGSKYNGGFIGQVLMDNEGNYHHTLGEELLPSDKEMLAAILILRQREQQIEGER